MNECFNMVTYDQWSYMTLLVTLQVVFTTLDRRIKKEWLGFVPWKIALPDLDFSGTQTISRKCDHFLPLYIPHFQSNTRKTFHNCERRSGLQRRNCIVTLLQMVIGDSGAQMVDMVYTNVTGKPP